MGGTRVGRISVTLNGFENVTDIRTKAHRRQAEEKRLVYRRDKIDLKIFFYPNNIFKIIELQYKMLVLDVLNKIYGIEEVNEVVASLRRSSVIA